MRNAPLPALQENTQAQEKCILCVDDSPTIRKILETCLRREGFVVYTFADGVEMMRWLNTPQRRMPDLIILDICLPKVDGYEIAWRLKTRTRFANIGIIMLTRRSGVMDRIKGRIASASVYLGKPFKTQELISVIKAQLGIPLSDEQAVYVPLPTRM